MRTKRITDTSLREDSPFYGAEEVEGERRKFYFDGGHVEIAAELVHELDADGRQLRVVRLTDYAAEKVRTICAGPDEFRARWADAGKRAEIIQQLAERGIDYQQVALQAGKPEADPFDLLCHLAYNAPLITRRQRADRMRKDRIVFFETFAPEARGILSELLEKYAADGELQFTLPDVLQIPPITSHGNVNEIVAKFGGAEQLRSAVNQLQSLLYAAYRDNPLREAWGGNYKTNIWGRKVFGDGSTYQRDWLTGKIQTKGRFGFWGRFD